jgi:ferric-dicitrate binding protein FerR (iron transport regulator)
VSVSLKNKSVILTAGEMVSFSKKAPTIQDVEFEMEGIAPKWINGLYTYTNQSLITIIQEIERQYDVSINYDKNQINQIRFNGSFENRMSLESVLETICWPFNLEFIIQDKNIHIQ